MKQAATWGRWVSATYNETRLVRVCILHLHVVYKSHNAICGIWFFLLRNRLYLCSVRLQQGGEEMGNLPLVLVAALVHEAGSSLGEVGFSNLYKPAWCVRICYIGMLCINHIMLFVDFIC